jgi:hypothetical protein
MNKRGEIRRSCESPLLEHGQKSIAVGGWSTEYIADGSSMKVLICTVRSPDEDSVDEGE